MYVGVRESRPFAKGETMHCWMRYCREGSVFNGMTVWVADIKDGVASVQFSDDGPFVPIPARNVFLPDDAPVSKDVAL